jgi:predicted dienelactone hydrolase
MSHGMGGSREGLRYLGEYLASNGYITVHPTHVGSDSSIVKREGGDLGKAMREGLNPAQLANRLADVKFLIDELELINADPKSHFHGKIDLKRVAVAGHSFGAMTTEAACGMAVARNTPSSPDPRIRCGVALSPAPPRWDDPETAFKDVKVPMLHLTGTNDDMSQLGGARITDRRVPFDKITAPDQYLVVLNGATHMTFAGGTPRLFGRSDSTMTAVIQRLTLEFLNAYDRDNDAAKTWLKNDAKAFVGDKGTFEMK